jgi:hypothetical protein
MQRWPDPGIVLAFAQHVPHNHGQLAGHRHGGNVAAAPGADPLVEGPQRTRATHRLPGCLHQHRPCVRPALFGDAPVLSVPLTGLMHTWVQPDVGNQLIWTFEPADRPDCCGKPERHHHVDAWNGHQPLDIRISQGIPGQFTLHHPQILAEAVILPYVPLHRVPLVRG